MLRIEQQIIALDKLPKCFGVFFARQVVSVSLCSDKVESFILSSKCKSISQ